MIETVLSLNESSYCGSIMYVLEFNQSFDESWLPQNVSNNISPSVTNTGATPPISPSNSANQWNNIPVSAFSMLGDYGSSNSIAPRASSSSSSSSLNTFEKKDNTSDLNSAFDPFNPASLMQSTKPSRPPPRPSKPPQRPKPPVIKPTNSSTSNNHTTAISSVPTQPPPVKPRKTVPKRAAPVPKRRAPLPNARPQVNNTPVTRNQVSLLDDSLFSMDIQDSKMPPPLIPFAKQGTANIINNNFPSSNNNHDIFDVFSATSNVTATPSQQPLDPWAPITESSVPKPSITPSFSDIFSDPFGK